MEAKARATELISNLLSLTLNDEEEKVATDELDAICPDPEWSDYVYASDEYTDDGGNVDISQIVDQIFKYKPISL